MMKYNSLVDCHVHCNYSDDCEAEATQEVSFAVDLGLKGIIFTDHYDLDYPNREFHFEFDIAGRREFLASISGRFKGSIEVLHGIEIGIQPQVVQQSLEVIKRGQFDFVICSTHAVDGFSLCSQSDFFADRTQEQAYRRYLEEIYAAITHFPDYDVVGHIGYVRRYGPYENRLMPYVQYADIIDKILKQVISAGKGIEINTSGYVYNLGTPLPDIDIIKRYKKLGGKIITIGSDAHTVERVAEHFDWVIDALKQVGFTQVAYFKQRKPIFQEI